MSDQLKPGTIVFYPLEWHQRKRIGATKVKAGPDDQGRYRLAALYFGKKPGEDFFISRDEAVAECERRRIKKVDQLRRAIHSNLRDLEKFLTMKVE